MTEEPTADRPSGDGLLAAISVYDIFLITAGLWFLGKFIRYAFPPLFEEFQASYTVSTTEIGLAYSGFLLLYALMQFPSGALADRFGSVRVITGGALLAAVGALIILTKPTFLVLAFAMVIVGAGTGAHKTVSVRLLSNIYPRHLGRALGVFDTIGTMGGVIAPLLIAAILFFGVLGWPGFFGITGLVIAVAAIEFYRRGSGENGVGDDASNTDTVLPLRSYRRTFSQPSVLAFALLTVLVAFAYNGLVSFLPLYLTVEGGLSPAIASALYSFLFIASVVQILSGEAADRFGALSTLTIGIITAMVGMAGLLGVTYLGGGELTSTLGVVSIILVVSLIGIGAHGYRPARDVYIVSIVPDATTGGTLGVIRTLLMGSAAVAPAVVGAIGDWLSLFEAFLLLTVVAGFAAAIALLLLVTNRSTTQ